MINGEFSYYILECFCGIILYIAIRLHFKYFLYLVIQIKFIKKHNIKNSKLLFHW